MDLKKYFCLLFACILLFSCVSVPVAAVGIADTDVVKNASIFSNKKYLNKKDFSTSCYGATSGARSVGTFTIPVDVTKVRLKTTGLTAYFLEGTTVATPSINTTFDVN